MISGFAEYHHTAARHLQENLQIGVNGYNTLCSCVIKGRVCEVVFKGKPTPEGWLCEEAVVDFSFPGQPKTAQNHKRRVVSINKEWTVAQAANAVAEEIKRLSQVNNVNVFKKGDLWYAQVEGKMFQGSGKTHLEAIGDLVMNNAGQFGMEVFVK